VEVPARWNGTLVLYSHGYHPVGFGPDGIALTNRPPDRSETERRLLEHGYALAASQFQGDGTGYQVKHALHDQIALLALVGALDNVVGWYSAHQPRPSELTEWIRQQAAWIQNAYVYGLGPGARADLERHAGGNPLWNVGVDYRRQLARSSQTELVREAYRAAGLSLRDDLDRLRAAPRIAPDREAVAFMYRYGVVRGSTPVPVLTLHSTGDGGAVADQEQWLAEQVRRHGDPSRLRQLYVDRGMHARSTRPRRS